jgi:protein TonB
MVSWLRPEYRADAALAGLECSVVLDLLIAPDGKPVQIALAKGSGTPDLDQAALQAARRWRFAPPRWNSRPVEVWGRVELRFHRR